MSKGSKRRPGDEAAYRRNFDAIFAAPYGRTRTAQAQEDIYALTREECALCVEYRKSGGPPHKASPHCRSGGRPHCSCDVCF